MKVLSLASSVLSKALRWLGIHWEPITAIAAIVASVWSGYAAWQAVTLAQKGIDLAASSQIESSRSTIISRSPYLDFSSDFRTQSLSIKNIGFGPGRIYFVKLGYDGLYKEFKHSDNSNSATGILYDYLIEINYMLGNGRLTNKGLDYKSPIRILNSGDSFDLFVRNGDNTDLKPFIEDAFDKMSGLVCFTDLAGDYRGGEAFGTLSRGDCPTPPEPLMVLN